MRIAFTTLGCRLNQFETEGMSHRVGRDLPGSEVVDWAQEADVYVINSCAVTARAEQKCRQLARAARRRWPEARVVLAGCYSQLAATELASRPEFDAVLGNEEKKRLPEFLPAILAGGPPTVAAAPYRRGQAMAEEWIEEFGDLARATVKVQEGCDLRCTFCTIWRARGPSRSRPPREVLDQTLRLVESGHEEIVLAGVHLGHYGRDLEPALDLAGLVDLLAEGLAGRARLRLSSIDPGEVDTGLVRRLVEHSHLCRYLHLPLQSGSDRVLRSMRRAYSAGCYRRLVDEIAAIDPGFGLGVDVIVGFPGEDDADFEATRALLDALPVSFYHVFRYSDRPGTAAERLGPKVEGRTAARRSEILRAQGEHKRLEFVRSHLGRPGEALVESVDAEGMATGILDDNVPVRLRAAADRVRRRVGVRVVGVDPEGRAEAVAESEREIEG